MAENLSASSQEMLQVTALHEVIADLYKLEKYLTAFLQDIKPAVWSQRGQRVPASEWTLHQTVAHLASAAEFYYLAFQHTLQHEALPTVPDFRQRRDLPLYNQQEILRRQHLQPSELIASLQRAITGTAALAHQLAPKQGSVPIALPLFNRPLTILELLETQTTHPGIVHAAQIALPAGKDPLWSTYQADFMHRMLTRFFHLMTLTYWPERGGDLRATLQFLVAGEAGGKWYINISPTENHACEGKAAKPQIILRAAHADALCQLFTMRTTIIRAALRRELFVWGDPLLASRLFYLFSPT